MKNKYGAIIGRFQTPELHDGHKHLIRRTLEQCENIIYLIGCSSLFGLTPKNPLPYVFRREMIRDFDPRAITQPLYDMPSDLDWSVQVDKILNGYDSEGSPIYLYHSRDSFLPCYTGNFPPKQVSELEGFSATQVRQNIQPENTPEFRRGFIYAINAINQNENRTLISDRLL